MYSELLNAFRQASGNKGFNFDNAMVIQGDNNIIVKMLNGDSYKIIASDNTVKVEKIIKSTNTETTETTETNTEVLESKKAQLVPIFTNDLFDILNDIDPENIDSIIDADERIKNFLNIANSEGDYDEQAEYVKDLFRTLKLLKDKYDEFSKNPNMELLKTIHDGFDHINKKLDEDTHVSDITKIKQHKIRSYILSYLSENLEEWRYNLPEDFNEWDDYDDSIADKSNQIIQSILTQIDEDGSCKAN